MAFRYFTAPKSLSGGTAWAFKFGQSGCTATFPTSDIVPQRAVLEPTHHVGIMDITVAICSALTLPSSAKSRCVDALITMPEPTRQQVVFQQFHDAGVYTFALQETRLQRICT